MKGVILCGGMGTRLRPATFVLNKHLVPIGNYPMILFSLATLKSFGIQDVLIVTGGEHVGDFAEFLGDGSQYGVRLTYKVQKNAGGIAEGLGLAEEFVGNNMCTVILGDNVFGKIQAFTPGRNATIFLKTVPDASRFGVYMGDGVIVEKPAGVTEGDAVTGLYVYPPTVFDFIRTLKPSDRGEMEITAVNNFFLSRNECDKVHLLNIFWSDCGTTESLANTTRYFLDNPEALSLLK